MLAIILLGLLAMVALAATLFRSFATLPSEFLPIVAGGMSYINAPANQVHAGGTSYERSVQTYKVKTAAGLKAGVFVIMDTTDDEIKVAGADAVNVIGVLTEKNHTNPTWDPTSAPAAGDEVDVILCGSGAWAKVWNATNLATTGTHITTDASGYAKALQTDTAVHAAADCGRTLIAHDGSGTAAQALLVVL